MKMLLTTAVLMLCMSQVDAAERQQNGPVSISGFDLGPLTVGPNGNASHQPWPPGFGFNNAAQVRRDGVDSCAPAHRC